MRRNAQLLCVAGSGFAAGRLPNEVEVSGLRGWLRDSDEWLLIPDAVELAEPSAAFHSERSVGT